MGSQQPSWKQFIVYGSFLILFAGVANLIIFLGGNPDAGRVGSWAVLGIPLGVIVLVMGVVKKRRSGAKRDE
jgi:hypothetical protein